MDYCNSPKVLLLGISYPDVLGHMAAHNYSSELLQNSELSVDQAVECVQRKILTEMDGRDLARCVATEQAGGSHEVYTVSKELGGIYREDRHVYASFNNSRGMRKAMKKAFGHVRFQQVILDYYWMPTGWLVTRWNKTLFQETLPDLVKYDMLAFPGSRTRSPRKAKANKPKTGTGTGTGTGTDSTTIYNKNCSDKIYNNELELEEGVVFLPFCAHVCKELVGGIDKLKPYYAITFVKKSELPGHSLWKGTMAIEGNVMQHRLGKRLDQEEIYCTFAPKDIYESMEDAHVNKDDVMEMLLSIEDFENIRMIRLRPLRQHEPPSVFRKSVVKPEIGGFIGLNWELGRQKFKEFRTRKVAPVGPSPKELRLIAKKKKMAKKAEAKEKAKARAEAKKIKKKKDKDRKPKKKPVTHVHDSESEVETDNSVDDIFDSDSDSSSDEDEIKIQQQQQQDQQDQQQDQHKGFNPYDRASIPDTTHYFPYPALDIESYMISKELVDNDRVMAFYDKTWGPKLSRKKNKKQGIVKQDVQRFKETQRDYLSSNPRRPIRGREHEQEVEGYKWTLVGNFNDGSENDESENANDECNDAWRLSLKGDDPDSHLVPKIIELAKRDNEMAACRQLFEMKNPGFKKCARSWINGGKFTSCYQIPKLSIITKMDAAAKAKEKIELETATDCGKNSRRRRKEYNYFDDESESIGAEQDRTSALFRFADVAVTAPVISDDFRLLCEESKGLFDAVNDDNSIIIPSFKPKSIPKHLSYDLSPHENFPRELFRLMQDAEDRILDHIVCWQKEGRSFIVKDQERFEKDILHQCYQNTDATFQSFLTTITSYGFSEIQIGKRKGGYRHNLFQRGKPKRVDQLVREGIDSLLFVMGADDKSVAMSNTNEPVETINDDISSQKFFIANLYQLLRKSKSLGLDDTIHWEESGKSFKVHKLNNKFSATVLKKYLSITQYSIFKRELIERGFNCKEGKKYGIYKHPNFARGDRGVADDFEDIKPRGWRKRKIEDEAEITPTNPSKKQKIEPKNGKSNERPNERLTRRTPEKEKTKPIFTPTPRLDPYYGITNIRYLSKRLYQILEESTERGLTECIRWLPDGDGFFVSESSYFQTNFLQKYTRLYSCSEFEYNLERLGFEKTDSENCGSIYKHQHFVRGQEEKACLLQAIKPARRPAAICKRKVNNSKSSGKDNGTSSADSLSTKKTSKGIEFPRTDSCNGKNETTDSTYSETKNEEEVATESPNSDVVQIGSLSPQPEESLPLSSEEENSDLRLAISSVAISPLDHQNGIDTDREKRPGAMHGSPGLLTERQFFPLSTAKAPKAKKSAEQCLHNNGDNKSTALVSANGAECEARSKKSVGRPKLRAVPKEKSRSKKRKIVSATVGARTKVSRKRVGLKPTGRRNKTIVVPGKTEPSSLRRNLKRSQNGSAHMASPPGRGLRPSTKVCGIDTMHSMTTASFHSRHLDNVSKSRSIDRQMRSTFELTNDTTLSESNLLGYSAEEKRISSQISTRLIEEANSIRTMVITPPLESGRIGKINALVNERLSAIGLSERALNDLLSAFSSEFGRSRSKALETVIFWHAGLFVPHGNEIELLVQWTSSDPTPNNLNATEKLNKLLKQCLVVENCAHLLSVAQGIDWYDRLSATASADPNSLVVYQLQKEVSSICAFSRHDVITVHKEMMKVLITNQKLRDIEVLVTEKTDQLRKIQKKIQVMVAEKKLAQLALEEHQQRQRLQQIEKETEEAVYWQRQNEQELYLSQNNSNISRPIINILHRLQPSGDDNNERAYNYNEGLLQNFTTATIAAGNNENANDDMNCYDYNHNTRTTSMMQQHCMHYRPPFGN